MYSIKQIRQSTLGQHDCMKAQHLSRTSDIRETFSFGLRKFVNAICAYGIPSRRLYVLMYNLSSCMHFGRFVDLYKFVSLFSDYSSRLHHDGRIAACHLLGVLKLLCAYGWLPVYTWTHGLYGLHKQDCNDMVLHAISAALANRNQNRLFWHKNHVLKESFSWT